jgi:hypothetical protein
MRWPGPSSGLRGRVLSQTADAIGPVPTARIAGVQAAQPAYSGVLGESVTRVTYRWRRFGVAAVCGLLLIVASCAGFDVIEGHRVEAEVARFEARYGSLQVSAPASSAVPPADNRALVIRAAANLAVGLPGRPYHYIDFHTPAPVPPDLRAFAETNREAIRVAGDVRSRKQSSWGIDSQRDMLPYQPIRILSDAVFVTALVHVEAGQADDATHDVVTGLGIAASLGQEPPMFVQFLRITVAQRQIEAIREIITQLEPSPAALLELASLLAEDRTPEPMLPAVLDEVRSVNAMFARMEDGDIDPNVVSYIYPMTWPSWPSVFVRPAARLGRPFVRQARVRYLQYMGQILDVLTSPRPHPAMPELPSPKRWELVDRLTEKFAAFSAGQAQSADNYMSAFGATRIAVALRRYRQALGTYPENLSALVPRFLESLPINPFTGQPPMYARQGGGFTLHAPSSIPPKYVAQSGLPLDWNVAR